MREGREGQECRSIVKGDSRYGGWSSGTLKTISAQSGGLLYIKEREENYS